MRYLEFKITLKNSQDWNFYEFDLPDTKPWDEELKQFVKHLEDNKYRVKTLNNTTSNLSGTRILIYDENGSRLTTTKYSDDVRKIVKDLSTLVGVDAQFKGEYNFQLHLDITTML